MPTAAMRPDASYNFSEKEAHFALPFCLRFGKACVIIRRHAGLVYRYYSSFPSWLGGFDSRTLLQKKEPSVRAVLSFGITRGGSRTRGLLARRRGRLATRGGLPRRAGRLPYPALRRRSLRTAQKRQSRKRLPFPHLCCVSPPFKIGPAALGSDFAKEGGRSPERP